MIRFENVTFSRDVVRKMKRDEFVSRHLRIFWRDKDEQTRKKMLLQVYDLCAGTNKTK